MRRVLMAGVALALGALTTAGPGPAIGQTPPREIPAAPRLTGEALANFSAAVRQYRAGDYRACAQALASLGAAALPISEYALYLAADCLARVGDAQAAAAAAVQAADRAPDGPLAPTALLLGGDQASRAGQPAEAATTLRRFLERHPDHGEVMRARFMLAQALQASGQGAEAAALYRQIWIKAAAAPFADSAAAEELVLAGRGVSVAPPTARERLERAERLLGGGRPEAARAEAENLLGETPAPDLALGALRVVAEASRRAGKYDAATRAVDRGVSLASGAARAPWLLDRARLQRRQDRDGALATLRQLGQEFPRSAEAPEALLLTAGLLDEAGRGSEAEAAYLRVAAEYPDDSQAGAALWRVGWIAWERGAPAEAADRWGRLLKVRGGQAYRDAAAYWVGRAHESRGDGEAAKRQFASVVGEAPRSYYGVLASARLGGGSAPSAEPRGAAGRPPVALPADPIDLVRGEPGFAKADALRAVGLGEFVEGEVEALGRRVASDPARSYAVAAVHVDDARYHLAIRILRRDFFQQVRTDDVALPRPLWEMLYPLGWRGSLEDAASRAAVDPLLVAAVVREESSFFPRARSRVGARGLMQLMPETARPMARQRGFDFRGGDLLDEPAANLDMGAAYLAGLVRQFGDPRLAVAAYNAGPGRVRGWLASRRPDDIEVWIEQIPFNETRAFVKRVVLSWSEYRRLYMRRP